MITHHRLFHIIIASCSLFVAGAAFAQMDPGFLGKRYVGAGFFFESVNDADLDAGTGLIGTANLPLGPFIDINGFASYERFSDYDIRDERLGATVVVYKELEYFKPFIEGGVAGTWQSSTFGGVTYKRHDGIYIAGLGVEAAVGRTTAVFLKADFNKYLDSDNGDYWTYTAGINTWFNEKIGGSFAVAFNESETTVFTFGLAYRF